MRVSYTARPMRRPLRFSMALAALCATGSAAAQPSYPAWPERAVGQAIPLDGVRPRGELGVLRSTRAPVDVHVGVGVPIAVAESVRDEAERALDAMQYRLRIALPLPDGLRGGTPALDVYVTRDGPAVETSVDALVHGGIFDVATAFVRVRATDDAIALKRAVAEGLCEAAVLGQKADHPRAWVQALGASLAGEVTGLAPDATAVATYQRSSARAVLGPGLPDDAPRGAGAFFDWLGRGWDDPRLTLRWGVAVAPAQRTPLGWARFWNEPDGYDVLRRVFRDEPRHVEGMFLGFAEARAAGDGPMLAAPTTRTVRYESLPAWGVPTTSIDVTGIASMTVDLRTAPLRSSVAVWVHASPWQRWMAAVVRLDASGNRVGALESEVITDGEWSAQVDGLDGAATLVVVAINLGDGAPDPDVPDAPRGFVAFHVGRG